MESLQHLPVARIHHRPDARQRSDDALMALAESIEAVGLINPIRVRPLGDDYQVVAGSHRLQAVELCGHSTIAAFVVTDDDLRAELAMIDENLCRSELSAGERAQATARRKAIYLELHPETGHGGDRASRQVGDSRSETVSETSAERFTAATAKVTGQSERTVQRDAERGEKITAEAFAAVKGTVLNRGAYLDKLKEMPPETQAHMVKLDLETKAREKAERDAAAQRTGGIAGRYAQLPAAPTAPNAAMFNHFVSLVDSIEAMDIAALVAAAGRQRAVLGQRSSGLIDWLGQIMERLQP